VTVQAWATAPENAAPDLLPASTEECTDPACVQHRVGETGARTLCRMAGVDYDALAPHEKSHYAAIAMEVMADMSERLIELRAVELLEDDDVIDAEVVGEG
jgi:hypothetical protein